MATSKRIDPAGRAGEKPATKSGRAVEGREPIDEGFHPEPAPPDPGGERPGPAREGPPKHLPRPTRR
jgi:hypothetical protein